MIKINLQKLLFIAFLLLTLPLIARVDAASKNKDATENIAAPTASEKIPTGILNEQEQQLQDQVLRDEILKYVKTASERDAGEGWIFLARHYRELRELDRSLLYLRTLLRSEHINPRITWEAMLLKAEILEERKEYSVALKELEKLIDLVPARNYFVRAKIARAKILGRYLTGTDELFAAFKRYYWPFPEKPDSEAIDYLIGFERGYDLEIAMKALTAWEEIAGFPEVAAANLANLRIAMLHAFDLNNPKRAIPFIDKIADDDAVSSEAAFLKAVIKHFYIKEADFKAALADYTKFRKKTESLIGYRIAGILQSQLLSDVLSEHETAVSMLQTLLESPPHLTASESLSLLKRREMRDEEIDWAMLACRMAGYICEFKLQNLDRARYFYKKIDELNKERSVAAEDPLTAAAIKRTEPSNGPAEALFEMAYEKYRSHKLLEALALYEEFIDKYPEHTFFREALFRTAVIVDDDLRQYEEALKMYQRYLIKFAPVKSTWELDVLYDWGRIDEVRYRIANLLALHLKKPVDALEVYSQLAAAYPDSYWAYQGMKDSIRIYNDDLGDPDKANEVMFEFIAKYPDSRDASDYRLVLYKILLQKDEQVRALHVLRDYLDHALPSEKQYFSLKQQWRDLAFKIREESLRRTLDAVGANDRIAVYQNLVDVVCLASTSAPLENLVSEIKSLSLDDEIRWLLVYEAGTRMYQNYPQKASKLFEELARNATGTPQIACLLTLGNIAYRVEKNIDAAVSWYEKAEKLLPRTDPRAEIPAYRLGRLYLAQGDGLKGLKKLLDFTRSFSGSKYLAKAFMAIGDACTALYNADRAARFYRRVMRVAPVLVPEAEKKLAALERELTSEEWLKKRAEELKKRASVASDTVESALPEEPLSVEPEKIENVDALTAEDLQAFSIETLYGLFLMENQSKKPDGDRMAMFLVEILARDHVPADLRIKALKQLVSTRFFRFRDADKFIEEATKLLVRHNYAEWQAELLFRLAQTQDYFARDFVAANKSYFEYLSFYSAGRRVEEVRRRIPAVYALAEDKKNARRFYEKLVEDNLLNDEIRVDASIQLARLLLDDEKKAEATKTLEAALTFKSVKSPEICLRLEKLTEDFSYVKRALEYDGEEEIRLKALGRLVKKAEEDNEYQVAAALLRDFADTFKTPEALVYIEKKVEELNNRGAITEIETLIDQYPEEPETVGRMFRLAKLVEGAENTRYRSEDLFYEITLVYPHSEFFTESKIRSENTRAIRAISELGDILKKGVQGTESEEILLERARLLKEDLKDLAGASENYESFVRLFPASPRLDEVYLELGEITLAENGGAQKAFELWEKGLSASRDPFIREELTRRINGLRLFTQKLLYSENTNEHEQGLREVLRVWRIEKDRTYALGLLESALAKLENRPDVAKMRYLAGRIYEEAGNFEQASVEYEKALRSLYHPGCRKDMVFYRLARINAARNKEKEAAAYYLALASRYPRSMLSRSAFYWLHKHAERNKNYSLAHHYLEMLIGFKSLNPLHREAVIAKQREIEARLNIEEMERLKSYSKTGGSEFPFYIGKVLENNLRDYDRAITQYEEFLKTNPPVRRSREILKKIADLYEKKGDFVKTVSTLDTLLSTYEPSLINFDLIIRIGSLVEDKLLNPELTNLFFTSIAAEYRNIRKIREFAEAKLRRLEEQKRAQALKPRAKKVVKRVYSEDDEAVLEEIEAIIERQVDDLQDFKEAERQLEDLWDENIDSLATLDIMKTLVELNNKQLMDPQKAAGYYQRWIDENTGDPLLKEYTMKLYEHYMDVLKDGQKALRLLEDYIREHPISIETMDIELKLAKANEFLILNYDEARRIYQRIIDTRQNDPVVHEAYFRVGFVLREGFANYDEAIKTWQLLIDSYYNNDFADKAQFAIAYTYEAYRRDFTLARQSYEKILNLYPNSSLQNQAREALIRIEGK
ncbi:MAG: tetratricopeptide repeat protein [Erysipelotrichia bacterium]|nr:tetratricopeptide repeat protein [Erysipelotrichia bacterium]